MNSGSVTRGCSSIHFPVSQNYDLASLGFSGDFLKNVTYKQFPAINVQTYNSGSGLSVTGSSPNDFGQLGGPTRTLNPQDNWQLQYQLNWIKTRHNIRFGTDLQLIRLNAYNSQYSAGQFNFDRTYTQGPDPTSTTLNGGNGLASLLLGIPVAGTITITNPLFLYQKYYSLFVQDDYRITNKLTLNLGLRWEYQTPYAEKFGQIGYVDWNAIEPTTGQKGKFTEIKPGGYQENPQYWNFSPRLGLAWTASDKTVIRAGAGIFFTTFVGVNAAATDFGNGGFISNFLFLGQPNALPNTPPVGGSWNNPFAAGIQMPTPSADFVGQAIRGDQLNRPKPYLSDWTLSIQREITPTLLAEVGYVGSKFTHLFWNRQHNQNDPALSELRTGPVEIGPQSVLRQDYHRLPQHTHSSVAPAAASVSAVSGRADLPRSIRRHGVRKHDGARREAVLARPAVPIGLHAFKDNRQYGAIEHLGGRSVERALRRQIQSRPRSQRRTPAPGAQLHL